MDHDNSTASRRPLVELLGAQARARFDQMAETLGRGTRRRVILLFAAVLGLSDADAGTVGAAAHQIRQGLHLSNTDLGLLLAVSAGAGAVTSVPFGALVDRLHRVRLLTAAVCLWGVAIGVGALATSFPFLMLTRIGLSAVTAVGGPAIASLLGDFFAAGERSRIYGLVLGGQLVGSGIGILAAALLAGLSWRACFAVLVAPAFVLAWFLRRLPEPPRGQARSGWLSGTAVADLPAGGAADAPPQPPGTQGVATVEGARVGGGSDRDGDGVVDPEGRLSLWRAAVYVLRVRTNVVLILSGASAYFFFAGVRTFGIEFSTEQYHVSHASASTLTLLVGVGAIGGVLAGGWLGDRAEPSWHAAGRVLVALVAFEATVLFVGPALLVSSALVAVPLFVGAGFSLSAVNPPLDAARLAIMPHRLWGRAEAVRSVLQRGAEASAPLLFGLLADHAFGGGAHGLHVTFLVMLLPLAGAGAILAAALRTYPRDAARAADGDGGLAELSGTGRGSR